MYIYICPPHMPAHTHTPRITHTHRLRSRVLTCRGILSRPEQADVEPDLRRSRGEGEPTCWHIHAMAYYPPTHARSCKHRLPGLLKYMETRWPVFCYGRIGMFTYLYTTHTPPMWRKPKRECYLQVTRTMRFPPHTHTHHHTAGIHDGRVVWASAST